MFKEIIAKQAKPKASIIKSDFVSKVSKIGIVITAMPIANDKAYSIIW